MSCYLDTHVVAWLYAGRVDLLPAAVRDRLEEEELMISPMVLLELEYLFESGKVREGPAPLLHALGGEIGLKVCPLPFPRVEAAARRLSWTRDPFDRLIAGHAQAAGRPLVTRDRSLRHHLEEAVWDEPRT